TFASSDLAFSANVKPSSIFFLRSSSSLRIGLYANARSTKKTTAKLISCASSNFQSIPNFSINVCMSDSRPPYGGRARKLNELNDQGDDESIDCERFRERDGQDHRGLDLAGSLRIAADSLKGCRTDPSDGE